MYRFVIGLCATLALAACSGRPPASVFADGGVAQPDLIESDQTGRQCQLKLVKEVPLPPPGGLDRIAMNAQTVLAIWPIDTTSMICGWRFQMFDHQGRRLGPIGCLPHIEPSNWPQFLIGTSAGYLYVTFTNRGERPLVRIDNSGKATAHQPYKETILILGNNASSDGNSELVTSSARATSGVTHIIDRVDAQAKRVQVAKITDSRAGLRVLQAIGHRRSAMIVAGRRSTATENSLFAWLPSFDQLVTFHTVAVAKEETLVPVIAQRAFVITDKLDNPKKLAVLWHQTDGAPGLGTTKLTRESHLLFFDARTGAKLPGLKLDPDLIDLVQLRDKRWIGLLYRRNKPLTELAVYDQELKAVDCRLTIGKGFYDNRFSTTFMTGAPTDLVASPTGNRLAVGWRSSGTSDNRVRVSFIEYTP